MRLLPSALVLAGSLIAALSSSSCASETCGEDFLYSTPSVVLPFEGAVMEDGLSCTIYGQLTWQGSNYGMNCQPSTDGTTCWCSGGGPHGVYEVSIRDLETGEELDSAELTIVEDLNSTTCRYSTFTREFEGYFPNWREDGMGGAGGMSNPGGAGGEPSFGGAGGAGQSPPDENLGGMGGA